MTSRPAPRSRPPQRKAVSDGADPHGSLEVLIDSAETVLAGSILRLTQMTAMVEETRRDLEALREALHEAAGAPVPEIEPLVTPPPIAPRAVAPPPVVATPVAPPTSKRLTTPLDETVDMGDFTPEGGSDFLELIQEKDIRFNCTGCGVRLSAPVKFVGKAATCKCGTRTTVPKKSTREQGK